MFSVREIQAPDIELITNYWLNADESFLIGMGVALERMPSREQWQQMLSAQLDQGYQEKQSYCTIWEINGQPVGHCNVNKIKFGEEAYMHLHLWRPDARQKGAGSELLKLSLPYFFENLELEKVLCEPYRFNPGPNRTLEKVGFKLMGTYTTTPGWLNFEQEVNLWEFRRDQLG